MRGKVFGARERELELALRAVGDVLAGLGDRRPHRRGVAGGEQRPEDRRHQRAAQVALQIRRSRRHADPLNRHGAGERVRRRGAREPHADPQEHIWNSDLPVRAVLLPEQEHEQERNGEERLPRQERPA